MAHIIVCLFCWYCLVLYCLVLCFLVLFVLSCPILSCPSHVLSCPCPVFVLLVLSHLVCCVFFQIVLFCFCFFFSCFVLLYVVLFVMTLQNWLKYTLLGLINSAQDALCVVSVACNVQNLFSYWECKRDSMGYIHIPLFLWKLSFILWFIDSSNVPCLLCVLFQEALLSQALLSL